MLILAIDPGATCGWVEYNNDRVTACGVCSDAEMMDSVDSDSRYVVLIEKIESYGMAVGEEVFEACRLAGRLQQKHESDGALVIHIPRRAVKLHLCGSTKAKDVNIRQALLDKFGGKAVAVGNKKNPGPLYGVKSHAWAALAIAVTYAEGGWKP